jgi:exodeoxyribonuclease V beta subunit
LFTDFEKFTLQKLNQSVKKNHKPPSHDFFRICDHVSKQAQALEEEMKTYLVYFKRQLFSVAKAELVARKSERNIQFFDDLLILVRGALNAKRGNWLAEAVRKKYKAALVDEFQDTDSVQYEIFSRLFSTVESPLFLIGDPKQAIYSFRGADIFSYMSAARHARSKFTLTENWRSEPHLVTAMNTIFSNSSIPFIFEEIQFEEGKQGNRGLSKTDDMVAPLTLWYLDSRKYTQPDKPIDKTTAVQLIAAAVAQEIRGLITSSSNPEEPGDIAVLVRTNRQAQIIQEYLTSRRIPSVLYSTGNIFDSQEAMEMEKILTSISEPNNMGYLKAALVMNMMGMNAEDLFLAENESLGWEHQQARFRNYHQLWNQYGFMRMFRSFLAQERVRERLLSFPNGERRLTNVLHLSEILHLESTEKNLGITGLLKWLAQQRDPSSPRLEEHQLRLESDERAIKIVTVHKSKGLEYPVVFCPYGWEGSIVKGNEVVFHDPDDDKRLKLDLGSEIADQSLILAQNELLAENVRLLYVALTRAKKRCYLAWGRISTAETSAIAYLLHGYDQLVTDYLSDDVVGALKTVLTAKTDQDLLNDLKRLVNKSKGSIQVLPLPGPSEHTFTAQPTPKVPLVCRKFFGKIDRSWKVSSYSSLVSKRTTDIDLPDRDASIHLFWQPANISSEFTERIEPDQPEDIFLFPKGAQTGNFFHEIFEHLDYMKLLSSELKDLVVKKLQEYGFDKNWKTILCDTISHTLTVPLQPGKQDLFLASLKRDDRINEMEFYFPLNPINPKSLLTLFRNQQRFDKLAAFPNQLEKLVFAPASGFMKGYIDLIFKKHDKFYLVDWKTNHLGSTLEDYNQDKLHQTMIENFYILQYHLYSLALCQYLKLRQPDFRYVNDFGGVFYIFIRGVNKTRGPEFGIFYDLPDSDLMHDLGKALIPGFSMD